MCVHVRVRKRVCVRVRMCVYAWRLSQRSSACKLKRVFYWQHHTVYKFNEDVDLRVQTFRNAHFRLM